MAWALGGLADVARLRADYKRAIGMFTEALSLYQSSFVVCPPSNKVASRY